MDGGGSAVIEDRYYSKAEYGKMSQGNKKLLWDRRQKRGGQDGQEKERPLKRLKTVVTVASLNRKVAALEKKLASKDEDKSANDDESVDQDKSSGSGGNRTNRALTRQQA